jgi:hypothetical protein
MHLIQEPDDVAGIEVEARDSMGCLGLELKGDK